MVRPAQGEIVYTLKTPIQTEIKILRSRFICALYPAADPDEARLYLNEHTRKHEDATHNCYAYLCGFKQEISYYSDAGEPGGTAGKPILNAMLRHDLTNVLAVVTRYYGGIKLGVKGLIEAYGESVETAVREAQLIVAKKFVHFVIECDYALVEILKHKLHEHEGEEGEATFAQRVTMHFRIPAESETNFREILDGYHSQSRVDYSIE
jgi:uncharacterized YigZ family protein